MRDLLFLALDAAKYSIDFAINGSEAIDMFRNRSYDVVITDVQMPILDGVAAARQMRRIESETPHRRRVPIIALTAGAAGIDGKSCFAAGMDAFLPKPIDLPRLSATIRELADHGSLTWHAEGISHVKTVTLNVAQALGRLQGDQELFKSIAVFFIEDYAELVKAIQSGIRDEQPKRVAQALHSLKGLAASVGGDSVKEVSNSMEELAKDDRLVEVEPWLPSLNQEISKLLTELNQYIA